MCGEQDGDYWADLTAGEDIEPGDADDPVVVSRTIEAVVPLDSQFGAADPLTVPPALRDELFGQTELIDGGAILPMRSYAVLDAGKVLGLPEMLEASGLEHACLFQGKAAEDLRDLSPWIVGLEDGHGFTRRLFTRGDAPWQMWDAASGYVLRSTSGLNELREHLRRFTKVREASGRLAYFRLHDPAILKLYLEEADPAHALGLFRGKDGVGIERLIYRDGPDWISVRSRAFGQSCICRVDPEAAGRIALFFAADRELAVLTERGSLAKAATPEKLRRAHARQIVRRVHGFGFQGRYHLRYFVAWALIYGAEFDRLSGELRPIMVNRKLSIEARFQSVSEMIRTRLGKLSGALFG